MGSPTLSWKPLILHAVFLAVALVTTFYTYPHPTPARGCPRVAAGFRAAGLGESAAFMRRIGVGDRIFVIPSEKRLRSPYCTFELSEIWRTSRQEGETFLSWVRVYVVDELKVLADDFVQIVW